MFWLFLVTIFVLAGCIEGEIVSVRDATPVKGLPASLKFDVERGQQTIKLLLLKNDLNRQPATERSKPMEGKPYREVLHGGNFEVHLTKQNDGVYLRTLTGNFELNGENVHIEPVLDSKTSLTRAQSSTPYTLRIGDKVERRSLSDQEGESLLARYLLSRRAQKTPTDRKSVRQISTGFPLPTIDTTSDTSSTDVYSSTDMYSQWTESTSEMSEMTSSWSTPTESPSTSTYSTERTDLREETSQTSGMTFSPWSTERTTYSTENPSGCTDDFSECTEWLSDYYGNNLQMFCGRDGYDSWCCETCLDWESSPNRCKNIYSECQELLEDVYDHDYDMFCPTWDDSCCATCTGDRTKKPEGDCVDEGYVDLTCEELLTGSLDGDMGDMCDLFHKECCAMCSESEDKGGNRKNRGRNGNNRRNGGRNDNSRKTRRRG